MQDIKPTNNRETFLDETINQLSFGREYKLRINIEKGNSDRQGGWENCSRTVELYHGQTLGAKLIETGIYYEDSRELEEDKENTKETLFETMKVRLGIMRMNLKRKGPSFTIEEKRYITNMKQMSLF